MTAPTNEGGLRIIRLAAQNFKRLVAIDITTPDDDVVVISGENGAGKSTVFDAIAALFGGADEIDAEPLRRGQDSGFIKAAIGGEEVELVVKRDFKRGKDKVKSEVTVTTAKGFTPPGGPQAVLDGLYGALSFDAMAFDRMKPKDQLAELLRVFPIGVDLEEIAALNKTDYARRTDINRDAKAARVKAQAITVVPNLPAERVDESALIGELQEAGETNAAIETRKARRADTAADIERLGLIAAAARKKAADLRARASEAEDEVTAAEDKAAALTLKIEAAAALPDPVDASAIRAKIDDARKVNASIEWRENRQRLEAQAEELEKQSDALTAAMAAREKSKVDAIAAAKLPVPGLGFDENGVTFDGFPFAQAASSDRLVTSVAIGMAASPQLRVILVRDASLLTAKNRERIKALAKGERYQVWEEIATEQGEGIGIVIEEGAVKGAAPKAAS